MKKVWKYFDKNTVIKERVTVLSFENQKFIIDRVSWVGYPIAFKTSLEKRYFASRGMHGVVLQLDGRFRYHIISEGISHIMDEGGVLFLPKNLHYEVFCEERAEKSCICINFLTDNEVDCQSKLLHPKNIAIFRKLFTDAVKPAIGGDIGREERIMSCLYGIISEMKRELSAQSFSYGAKRKVAPAIEHIDANPQSDDSVGELAAMCGLNESFFRKNFHDAVGTSPVSYRNNARILYAASLLGENGGSIAEIAQASGFEDSYYFCRVFKKVMGVPPGKYIRDGKNM